MSIPHQAASERLLKLSEVRSIVPHSAASIYRMVSEGDFPAPLKLGKNRSAWKLSDIQDWIDSRPQPLSAA
jgi:prophage regulatory protein